ncbi:DUF572-domain-containing protein [Microstroma glucosiphilum]|uniref:Splicing factor YJU2 n=1 Tax=Pseudomicrostroma glucosiphilum TaxID=1684307 RepID=A0A316U5E1_9BASI|nr:DUF572-domain-containing protein [Pseudomicrostroma glucosiphilum]PWN20446.1 DUF572-domain-containing protein [Pseudomicrostroma glucosiphilum]
MAERKVLNKYFPPDFDPAKIKRRKQAPDRQQVVRLMAPFNMRCSTCGEFIYKGRKFNARKETALGETYYGIKIFRFYIKCTRCSAEITFKTDPKNTDYIAEHGATRNFEPWRDAPKPDDHDPLAHFAEEERAASSSRLLDENGDPMQSLEARQAESKREMEVLDALQDIRTRNAKLDRVDTGDVLDRLERNRKRRAEELSAVDLEAEERRRAEEEDEELVKKYFSRAEDMGGEDEERELREALAGGGAAAEDDEQGSSGGGTESTPGPSTPRSDAAGGAGAEVPTNGRVSKVAPVVVKRAYAKEEDGEPDAKSLLSDRAKALLHSSAATSAPSSTLSTGAIAAGGGAGQPAMKKKKTGPNAFGLVKKKK